MENDFKYTYVEGYGYCKGHIVHHAWCVNEHQEVLDRTWDKSEECHYFGIPFHGAFIREQVRRTPMLESVITPGDLGTIDLRLLAERPDVKHHFE